MKPELYQDIALTQDWEEFNRHRGGYCYFN